MSNATKRKINVIDLQVILAQVRTSTFATITQVTEPKMNKGGNPYHGRISKRTTMNVVLNFNYANSVNNQRDKESKELEVEVFVPHARKWGERIEGTPLVQHKGELYMEYKPNGKPSASEYFCDGNKIDKTEIAIYLPKQNSQAAAQGVEKEVIVRDVKLRNIAEIKINGEHLEII